MLLQRLPTKEGFAEVDVDDAWRRVQLIGDTLKAEELSSLSDREILRRLFNEDDLRLFDPSPVFFKCTCSHERVSGMLQSLGREEVQSVLAEQGVVEVRCDFCNRAYDFDAVDVGRLFAASGIPGGGTVH
jgi:molecular chaperone Hsp33